MSGKCRVQRCRRKDGSLYEHLAQWDTFNEKGEWTGDSRDLGRGDGMGDRCCSAGRVLAPENDGEVVNRKQRRQMPSRPKLINEAMRDEIRRQIGDVPAVFSRDESIVFARQLLGQLATLLNNKAQLPWLTAHTDNRADGISLHIQVLPTGQNDLR